MVLLHLARRFVGSLFAKELTHQEREWIGQYLCPGELVLWERFSRADKRHSLQVARRAERLLGERASRDAMAAAILHDIGKVQCNAGTFLRVVATLIGSIARPDQVRKWSTRHDKLGDIGRYLLSHEDAPQLLTAAGSGPLTIAWAREHELPEAQWTIDPRIAQSLHRADNI